MKKLEVQSNISVHRWNICLNSTINKVCYNWHMLFLRFLQFYSNHQRQILILHIDSGLTRRVLTMRHTNQCIIKSYGRIFPPTDIMAALRACWLHSISFSRSMMYFFIAFAAAGLDLNELICFRSFKYLCIADCIWNFTG